MSKQIDSNKQIDSSVAIAFLSTIPTADLAAVTGGYQATETGQGGGGGTTDNTTTTMNLTCPSGTTPDYTKITAGVDANVAGGQVKLSGNGSYEHFQCDPIATPSTKKK